MVGLCGLFACTPLPPEVSSDSADPTTTPGTSTGPLPDTTTTLTTSATVGTLDGTGDTTSDVTGPGPTTGEPPDTTTDGTTTGDGGSSSSSSDGGESSSSGDPIPDCTPILAETVVRVSGGDNGDEWIRIYNPCPVAIDLADYSLGWGGPSYNDSKANLSGIVASNDCWVVGGPNSNGGNGNPAYDLELNFNSDLQNGDDPGDGIALFDVPMGMVDAATVPVDSLIYGDNNNSMLMDSQGMVPAPYVRGHSDGDSLRRTSLGNTWEIVASPTPNDCPVL